MAPRLTKGALVTAYASHEDLKKSLPPLLYSKELDSVVVMNASGEDGTRELVERMGAIYLNEPKKNYNHGLSRERGRHFVGTDIVLMVTADAVLNTDLSPLFKPLEEGVASLAYARQLPKKGAGLFEVFPRVYNYGERSEIRSLEEKSSYGSQLIFCSDSFCAYLQRDLNEVGGFKEVLLGEDTDICARLLAAGKRVAYIAETEVFHSHTYSLLKEFQRHFDAGYMRREHLELFLKELGGDSRRGWGYAKGLFRKVLKEKPYLLGYAFLQVGAKWLGYHVGRRGHQLPLWLKQRLSSQKFYWEQKRGVI